MGSRLDLHKNLVSILGTSNVYYQPPESFNMSYPAIVYHLNGIDKDYADDATYNVNRSYNIILIDKNPDSEIVDALIKLPMCKFDRSYRASNLNHFAFTLYY